MTDPVEGADDLRKKGMASLTNDGRIELTRKGREGQFYVDDLATCNVPLFPSSPWKWGRSSNQLRSSPFSLVAGEVDILAVDSLSATCKKHQGRSTSSADRCRCYSHADKRRSERQVPVLSFDTGI